MRWNHTTGQMEVLVPAGSWATTGGVESLSVSADGRKVAYLWRKTIEQYEVAVLDLSTGVTTSLPLGNHPTRFIGLSISPDGGWVAYISAGVRPGGATGPIPGLAAPQPRPKGAGYGYGTVYAVSTQAGAEPIEVGFCSETGLAEACMWVLLWSPDSRTLVWSDPEGMWLGEPGHDPQLLVSDTVGVSPKQGSSSIELRAWSPLGRYILAGIGHSEGWNSAVIDSQSGQVAELPNMLERAYWQPSVTWMNDGRLFALKPGDIHTNGSPTGQIWSIAAGDPLQLQLEHEFVIDVVPESYPAQPAQLADGRLTFALLNASTADDKGRGLYLVELDRLTPVRVGYLPPSGERPGDETYFGVKITWSPDGSGAIFEDWYKRSCWYVPADGGPPYDLRPLLGEWAGSFLWEKEL